MENDSRRRIFFRCNQTTYHFCIYNKELWWETKIFEFHLSVNTSDSFVLEIEKPLKAFFTYNRILDFFSFRFSYSLSNFLSQTRTLTFLIATLFQSHSLSHALFIHSLALSLLYHTISHFLIVSPVPHSLSCEKN